MAGKLTALLVQRGMLVKPGDLLFTLEEEPEYSLVESAKAEVKDAIEARELAQDQVDYTNKVYERRKEIDKEKLIAPEDVDTAEVNYLDAKNKLDSANAKLIAAKAQLTKVSWTFNQKNVASTINASVFDTYYNIDEIVPANKAVLSLLDPKNVKVIFYVQEFMLSTLKIGSKIEAQVDGMPNAIPARISFISSQAEYMPPVLYSVEYRSKLVYRLEAEPDIKEVANLHPGQPVTVLWKSEKK